MHNFRRRNPNQSNLRDLDRRMILLLQSSGFYGVARVSSLQLDWSILSTLVESWRPETQTFHFPMGEANITLQVVAVLLVLPVEGDAVIYDVTPGHDMSWISYVGSVLGFIATAANFNGSRLRLSFVSSITPHRLPDDASLEDIWHQTLFYLV